VLPEGTPEDRYRFAFGLLRQARYDDAEVALRAFLKAHEGDPLAGNARYWLGETYYVRGDYQQAAVVFYEGYNTAPKGAKAADTLLKLGMSLASIDKKNEACATFDKLAKEFSDTAANIAKLVTRERQRSGCK
jgi:tol-pal system protein YbgF